MKHISEVLRIAVDAMDRGFYQNQLFTDDPISKRNRDIRARNRAMSQIGPMVGNEYKPMPELKIPASEERAG